MKRQAPWHVRLAHSQWWADTLIHDETLDALGYDTERREYERDTPKPQFKTYLMAVCREINHNKEMSVTA